MIATIIISGIILALLVLVIYHKVKIHRNGGGGCGCGCSGCSSKSCHLKTTKPKK